MPGAKASLAALQRRAQLLETANTARDGDGGARAKAQRDRAAAALAESYFSEGKGHNTAGDFWAAREYAWRIRSNPLPPCYTALALTLATPPLPLRPPPYKVL